MALLPFRRDPIEPPQVEAPAPTTLPYGRQDITREDLDAVIATLRSAFLTQGPQVAQFESALARYCQVEHAVAVNSATSALHIACLALDVGPGDVVWTSPISFVASANCARYCGAAVDFVDVDPCTGNLSTRSLQQRLERVQAAGGKLPKVVIPVHLAGQPCDLAGIAMLAERYGFHVIEDASHAIGARHSGLPVGNCAFSDITVFSFHPVKIITTAEGGVATTACPALYARMERLRTHGIDKSEAMQQRHPDEPWYYEQQELGYNYRMTDVQASLGSSQLQRLDDYVDHRHRLAERYHERLAGLPIRLPEAQPASRSSLHLFPIHVGESDSLLAVQARDGHAPALSGARLDAMAARRLSLFTALRNEGIGVAVHYIPIHLQPYYQRLGFSHGDLPAAEHYYAGTISLPLFGAMTFGEQDRVVESVRKSLSSDWVAGRDAAA